MDTITIPSPSAFLEKSPIGKTQSLPKVRPTKSLQSSNPPQQRPLVSSGHAPSKPDAPNGTTKKPKQSKSRNGCVTCKGKRLKCDESKPTCEQCRKRNVKCGGYSKAFKWRSFEEANFTGKSGPKPRKVSPPPSPPPSSSLKNTSVQTKGQNKSRAQEQPQWTSSDESSPEPPQTPIERDGLTHSRSNSHGFAEAYQVSYLPNGPTTPLLTQLSVPATYTTQQNVRDLYEQQLYFNLTASDVFADGQLDDSFGPQSMSILSPPITLLASPQADFFSFDLPILQQAISPGIGVDSPSVRERPWAQQPSLACAAGDCTVSEENEIAIDNEEDVEELQRSNSPMPNIGARPRASSDFGPFKLPFGSSDPSDLSFASTSHGVNLWAQPRYRVKYQEMLAAQFHRHTCGILSIKDGPNENPWRTVIWPLAQDSTHLYHAVASLTAFHSSKAYPEMRVDGMRHMHKSVTRLASSLQNMTVDDWRVDSSIIEAALATTLVLAFSESWDQHVSTGIKHLKGARYFVNQVVANYQNNSGGRRDNAQQSNRLKFLCNSYIYMDVIARLTSLEEDNMADFDAVLSTFNQPFDALTEIDPLMGAASTLFPLIGHVAGIITRVRRSESNSFSLISDALELKEKIEQWQPLTTMSFEVPEDPTSEVQHSLQTAEAYRWATLLYLHQAVPEIPSEPAAVLADRVLRYLATVPLSSRSIIVQIYPFLAASCEAVAEEDRKWITSRWAAMSSRMSIGNVDKCLEVIKEVWGRRDTFEADKADRIFRRQVARSLTMSAWYDPSPSWATKQEASDLDTSTSGLSLRSAVGSEEAPFGPGLFLKRRAMTGLPQGIKLHDHWNAASTCLDMDSEIGNLTSRLPIQSSLAQFSSSRNRASETPLESMESEYTVRGRLHWIGVMSDFGWEVFLG